ncbi:MAG: glutamate--tRNA ligase [Candidatus Woesearchaeota archaeon]|nr:glutamate--tRNA ligase [Candidatus Woesearchaeota archaeon]
MDINQKIRFFALENAIKFNGKANPGAVIGKILAEHPDLKADMKGISKQINEIIAKVNAMKLDEQKKEFESSEKIEKPKKEEIIGLPPLPNATIGKVVTRIPPEPSKYSHLGHALSFLINYTYAKMYDGKCIVRFEDTNPDKSSYEFADAIIEDIAYIGIKADVTKFVSDDMPLFYDMAEKLIAKKKAYVCFCAQEKMKELRDAETECECRNHSIEKNQEEWHSVKSGKYESGKATLRLLADMKAMNAVMRDPVIFRINNEEHFRQGNKYHAWPLYDFENSIEDSTGGVTHILRSSEFGSMRIELQEFIKDALGLPKQEVIQYGRFNIKGATTQGREIRELIESGKVSGWDDPSLVTIKALRRRGIVPETFKELMYQMKLSANTAKNIDWSMIESINRQILDPVTDRYFFIEDPVEINVQDAPRQVIELKKQPDNAEHGIRKFDTHEDFYVSKDDHGKFCGVIRLMDCLNFDSKTMKFHSLDHASYKKEGKMIIQWLPKEEKNVKVQVRMPDNSIKEGLAEASISSLKIGDIVQFQRFGFVKLDKIEKDRLVFWFTNK